MILFFDIETRGLPRKNKKGKVIYPRIWEMTFLVTDTQGKTIITRTFRIGVSDRQKIGCYKWISKQISGCSVIVSHNLDFDIPVLLAEYTKSGLGVPSFDSKRFVCTMKSSAKYCNLIQPNGSVKYPKLAELHSKLFKSQYILGAHNSLQDTIACKDCYFELIRLNVIQS